MLGIPIGTPVLRVDYISRLDDTPIGMATNHLTYPEASRLSAEMMAVDFYSMLRCANVGMAESVTTTHAGFADDYDLPLLDVPIGDPIIVMEQTIYDFDARPRGLDLAVLSGPGSDPHFVCAVRRCWLVEVRDCAPRGAVIRARV
jgi:DNA-binding GntR family transcriptional regulator